MDEPDPEETIEPDEPDKIGQIRSVVISRLFLGFFPENSCKFKIHKSSLSSYDAMICTNFQ